MAKTTLDTRAIMDIVRMQPPCLLLDRAEVDTDTRTVHAVKGVSANEPAFEGHFPGHPILPGVMQVEAMRQAALLLIASLGDKADMTFMRQLSRTKFRNPVQPGDRLRIVAELVEVHEDSLDFKATAMVEDQLTSECSMTMARPPAETVAGLPVDSIPRDPSYRPLSIEGIKEVIPHRSPFLFIDRLLHLPKEGEDFQEIISIKNITADDPYLSPIGEATVPPPFLVEVAAQTGCAYLLALPQNEGKIGYFLSIDVAEYHRPVRAGDVLVTHIRILNLRGRYGKCEGRITVGGELIGRSDVKFAFVEV